MSFQAVTVIIYRKNKTQCSLGYLQNSHDSELTVRSFVFDPYSLEVFLETAILEDLRLAVNEPWGNRNQYQFLINGYAPHGNDIPLMEMILKRAQHDAEKLFAAEQAAKRAAERAEQAKRTEAQLEAARVRDFNDLKRILNTYPVQELRDSLQQDFRL